jgi:hypothetical protein
MPSSPVERTDAPPADWAAFAAKHGDFYHAPAWLDVLARSYRFPLRCLTVRREGQVSGLLALAQVPILLGGSRLVSLPFSYAAGPLSRSAEDTAALLGAAQAWAKELGVRRLEVKHLDPPSEPAAGFSRVSRYATYRVDTSGGETAILKRLHADSTRRGIRKAEKEGVTVRHGTSEADWRLMADLEHRTARGHGVPAPPWQFFEAVRQTLQPAGLADLYLADVPGHGTSAAIMLWKGPRRWIYAFGASRPEALGARPNHALLWRALQDAAAAGVEFDLGRAAPDQESLVEFKRRWGGVAVPLAYDYWPAPGGLNTARRRGGTLALAAALWRRLPLPVTRAGSVLYRYLG